MSDSMTRIQPTSAALQSLVRELQGNLQQQYRGAEWQGLSQSLSSLSRMAEHGGQRSLCLQAQAISELLGNRGGGRELEAGPRVSQLMETLFSQLSNWSWTLDETMGASARAGQALSSKNESAALAH